MDTLGVPLSKIGVMSLMACCVAGCAGPSERQGSSPMPGGSFGPQTGQSGSEYQPTEENGGTPNNREYHPCPCEHLIGATPIHGIVNSWRSSVVELEVLSTPVGSDGVVEPAPGELVYGVYRGELGCQRGQYEPQIGDEVIAYVLADSPPASPFCCEVAECDELCSGEESAGTTDDCLSACQRPASEACKDEFFELGQEWMLSPVTDEGVVVGESGNVSVIVPLADLPLVFVGGSACEERFSDVQEQIEELPISFEGGFWRRSCSME